ncbi:MAG: methyltransferase domain-containing protein [Planctomycetota bacterium]|jgi:ubiquinone/menaquinone biosynthesis C-methylase UbiE
MSQPKGYVDPVYLQVIGDFVKHVKERSYALMQIQPGRKVLDVGCGPGIDTISLAALVSSTGQVVGVDYDPAMIAEAEQRAEKAGVSAWVKYEQADVASLPFEPDYFDSSRSERLFQHLLNPEQALSEMTRVTKSGGWIVVLDTDWGTSSVDTLEMDIERRLARIRAERYLNNGYAGRQLYRLLKRQRLENITVELFPLFSTNYAFTRQGSLLNETEREALASGVITSEELQRWCTSLEKADAEGVFFGSVTQIMVAGRKA